jgi:hypothetical protein
MPSFKEEEEEELAPSGTAPFADLLARKSGL